MKTLITPKQAAALAFTDGEYVSAECIAETDIAAAEQRYIVPVIGPALHARLTEGGYPEFTSDYLAAPAALFTRLMIQPLLDIRTGQSGTIVPKSTTYQPAATSQLHSLHRSLRTKARTLLRCAAEYLETNAAAFPEYDPGRNILRRCSVEGGLVQVCKPFRS